MNASCTLHKAVLKKSIAGVTLVSASALVQADTISTKIDLGEPYPFKMESGIDYEVELDIGYKFDSIEKICINTEPKDGDASWAGYGFRSETVGPDGFLNEVMEMSMLTYSVDLPTPENPDPVPQIGDINFCENGNSFFANNFLDGVGQFRLFVSGGFVEFWDIELVVEGVVSDIQLAIDIDESAEFKVPSYGGRVNYDASIRNLDSTQSLVTFEQWSVLKLPNGDNYPIHKSRDVVLNYSESKDYTRNYLNIPAWFEAGDYELIWYVTDPSTGNRVKDSLHFIKNAD
ncbi:RbmA family biofilm matrix protein [Microbulbifer sp. TRSA001]|uniref:RbmA family biofilm matrix protein n=1 Tax=Microbulbifer sp. TRSA001 TaxID=3243381 RepID=UPI004039D1AF